MTLYGVVKSTILEQKIQAVTVLMGDSAYFSTGLNSQSLLESPICVNKHWFAYRIRSHRSAVSY